MNIECTFHSQQSLQGEEGMWMAAFMDKSNHRNLISMRMPRADALAFEEGDEVTITITRKPGA